MLLHVSYVVRDPQCVAEGLARLLRAHALRAPSPPFPSGSCFVNIGDCYGSMIELLPWGSVFDPSVTSIAHDEHMRPHTGSHVLVTTPRTVEEVLAISREYSWPARVVHAGLFELIKIWIDDRLLIELITPEQLAQYTDHFGVLGQSELPARLATLESALKQKVAETA